MAQLLAGIGSGLSSAVSAIGSLGSGVGAGGLGGSLLNGFTALSNINDIAGGGQGGAQNPLQSLYPQQAPTSAPTDNSYAPNNITMGQGFSNWQQGQPSVSPFTQLVGSLLGK